MTDLKFDRFQREKIINEEYKIWKRHCPFLYDFILVYANPWPSLTAQWLPGKVEHPNKNISKQRLIFGTNTASPDTNYLYVAEVNLPTENADIDVRKYDQLNAQQGGFRYEDAGVKITQKISHRNEVNRARYLPQEPNIVATRSPTGLVYLFDLQKHVQTPPEGRYSKPDVILEGNTGEGFALSWSKVVKGRIASASMEKKICVWQVDGRGGLGSTSLPGQSQSFAQTTSLQPIHTIESTFPIQDVSWHNHYEHILVSAENGKHIKVWDVRTNQSVPVRRATGHTAEVNSVDCCKHDEHLMLSGSADRTVKLWDFRNLKCHLHMMAVHQDEVFQVSFSPFEESVFASCGADRRVFIWDLSRAGMEQTEEDKIDGPPELLFIHGGHTSRINEFSWNPNKGEQWMIGSVADDNVVQIWQLAGNIVNDQHLDEMQATNEKMKMKQNQKQPGKHPSGMTQPPPHPLPPTQKQRMEDED